MSAHVEEKYREVNTELLYDDDDDCDVSKSGETSDD